MILIELLLPLRVVGKSEYRPYATFFLTLGYLAVFFWEIFLTTTGGMAIEHYLPFYALNPCEVGQAPLGELLVDSVRGLFMSTELSMLLINLLFLWIFGPLVEQYFGWRRFVAFFFTVGLGGYFLNAILQPSCDPIYGPNSAISGIIAAFMFLYPGKRIETAVRPFLDKRMDFPAVFFGVIYLLLQFVNGESGPLDGTFLPVWDEVGGFFTGLLFIFIATMFYKPAPRGNPLEQLDDE